MSEIFLLNTGGEQSIVSLFQHTTSQTVQDGLERVLEPVFFEQLQKAQKEFLFVLESRQQSTEKKRKTLFDAIFNIKKLSRSSKPPQSGSASPAVKKKDELVVVTNPLRSHNKSASKEIMVQNEKPALSRSQSNEDYVASRKLVRTGTSEEVLGSSPTTSPNNSSSNFDRSQSLDDFALQARTLYQQQQPSVAANATPLQTQTQPPSQQNSPPTTTVNPHHNNNNNSNGGGSFLNDSQNDPDGMNYLSLRSKASEEEFDASQIVKSVIGDEDLQPKKKLTEMTEREMMIRKGFLEQKLAQIAAALESLKNIKEELLKEAQQYDDFDYPPEFQRKLRHYGKLVDDVNAKRAEIMEQLQELKRLIRTSWRGRTFQAPSEEAVFADTMKELTQLAKALVEESKKPAFDVENFRNLLYKV